jgi:predicted DNA-binding protein with PD1-like motif
MSFFEYKAGKELMVRIKHDSELIQSITEIAKNEGIKGGSFVAIGALKRAKFGYYDQKKHEYQPIEIETPQEIASCIGNISSKDGVPFVHAHAVLANKKGDTKAGHLLEGIVFAAEVHIRELAGPNLERKYDDVTGLALWQIKDE